MVFIGVPGDPMDWSEPKCRPHPMVPRKIAEDTKRNVGASPEHGGQTDERHCDTLVSFHWHCGAPVTLPGPCMLAAVGSGGRVERARIAGPPPLRTVRASFPAHEAL